MKEKRGLEEEYFRRKEQEALEKTRQRLAAEESEGNKALFTRCPKCSEKLEGFIFLKTSRLIAVIIAMVCGVDPGELERVTSKESRGWLARFWRGTHPNE